MNIFRIFLESSLMAQIIMSLLVILSIWSWSIFFKKLFDFSKIKKDYKFWDDIISSGSIKTILKNEQLFRNSFYGIVLLEGILEFKSSKDLENYRISIERKKKEIIQFLESNLTFLGTVVTISPFLGLLGTVWGVMISFLQIKLRGSAHITIVAPGISDALITTVYGLLVAIPALIFYNYTGKRIDIIESEMDNLSSKVYTLLKRGIFEE